jgi:hypothetical protein
VTNEVWEQVTKGESSVRWLCLDCLETRLGRPLKAADLIRRDGAADQRIDQPLAILLRVVKGSCEIAEAGRYVLLIKLLASAVTTAAPSLSRSVDGICLLSSTKSATGPSSDAKGSRRR